RREINRLSAPFQVAGGDSASLVVVPSRSAARQLGTGVTRDELYDVLHSRLADPPIRSSALERDVIAQAGAAAASAAHEAAVRPRPGLVAEMLRFYDHIRRQTQSIDRFEELLTERLGGGDSNNESNDDDIDSGAKRMRQQTRFLARAFREYDARVRASGSVDE